ncbi:immortalization up-regulated protein [Pangshura tecta]
MDCNRAAALGSDPKKHEAGKKEGHPPHPKQKDRHGSSSDSSSSSSDSDGGQQGKPHCPGHVHKEKKKKLNKEKKPKEKKSKEKKSH